MCADSHRGGLGSLVAIGLSATLWCGPATAASSGAPLVEVPPFAGDLAETFESFAHFNQTGRTPIPCGTSVFGGGALLLDSRAGIYQPALSPFYILDEVTGAAALVVGDGSQGLGTGILRGESAVTAIRFAAPLIGFGGLWASGEEVVVRFLDAADQVIAATEFLPTQVATFDGDLVWRGWTSSAPFVRIELEGINVAVDDLRAILSDEPGVDATFDELCNSGSSPAVATDGSGRSVRVFSAADSLVDTSSIGIYVEVADATGRRLAGPTRISQRVDGDQQHPAIAVDAQGSFAVVWQEERAGQSNVLGRRLRLQPSGGDPQKVDLVLDDEHRVNEPGTDSGDQPEIVPRGGGDWAVAWRSRNRVLLRPVDAELEPVEDAVVVADGSGGVIDSPALAARPDGELVVVWAFRASGAAGSSTASGPSVLGRRFDRAGGPLSGVEPVSSPGVVPAAVDVAASADGSTLVVWTEDQGSTRPTGAVVARWLGTGGTPLSAEIELGRAGTRGARPRAATSNDGSSVVVWERRVAPSTLLRRPAGDAQRQGSLAEGGPSILGVLFNPGSLEPEPGVTELVTGGMDEPIAPDVSLPSKKDIRLVYAREGPGGKQRGVFSKFLAPGCVPSAERLCLADGRFALELSWQSGSGSGTGRAVPLTADTGYFLVLRQRQRRAGGEGVERVRRKRPILGVRRRIDGRRRRARGDRYPDGAGSRL